MKLFQLITICLASIEFLNKDISRLFSGNYSLLVYRSPLELQLWSQIVSNHTKLHISTKETKLLALLQVKVLPSVKVLQNGKVYTFDKPFTLSKVQDFIENCKKSRVYGYLPTSYSKWTFYQLELYFLMVDLQEQLVLRINTFFNQLKTNIAVTNKEDL
jgi:hypothetical protein